MQTFCQPSFGWGEEPTSYSVFHSLNLKHWKFSLLDNSLCNLSKNGLLQTEVYQKMLRNIYMFAPLSTHLTHLHSGWKKEIKITNIQLKTIKQKQNWKIKTDTRLPVGDSSGKGLPCTFCSFDFSYQKYCLEFYIKKII